MPILGPFPDGGYELYCGWCNCKITCFAIEEIENNKDEEKAYENFICNDCLEILKK